MFMMIKRSFTQSAQGACNEPPMGAQDHDDGVAAATGSFLDPNVGELIMLCVVYLKCSEQAAPKRFH